MNITYLIIAVVAYEVGAAVLFYNLWVTGSREYRSDWVSVVFVMFFSELLSGVAILLLSMIALSVAFTIITFLFELLTRAIGAMLVHKTVYRMLRIGNAIEYLTDLKLRQWGATVRMTKRLFPKPAS